ncbi:hypothetical protein Tco_0297786, partial [Tanacetum coccineum]
MARDLALASALYFSDSRVRVCSLLIVFLYKRICVFYTYHDADMERAIKLSLDPAFLPQGQAPVGGVTFRDPVSETTPKLHNVVGKGKAIVTEEQVAHSLIYLSKKKRTTDQFILVRRDQAPYESTTGPSSQPEDDTSEKVIHESSSTS